jgi:hypothetical protein
MSTEESQLFNTTQLFNKAAQTPYYQLEIYTAVKKGGNFPVCFFIFGLLSVRVLLIDSHWANFRET